MDQRKPILLFFTLFFINAGVVIGQQQDSCVALSYTNFLKDALGIVGSFADVISKNLEIHPIQCDSVRFILYKKNGEKEYISISNASTILNLSVKTKFIVHGWQSNATLEWITLMADTYLKGTEEYNIVIVDWSEISTNNYVLGCIIPVNCIGEKLSDLIYSVYQKSSDFVQNTDILGHSCGAHIAGIAGDRIQKKTNGVKFGRIVGLDAAGPCFSTPLLDSSFCRGLQKGDALLVHGVQTNPGFYGTNKAYGDANVRFNGICQPICVENGNILATYFCSHLQSTYDWTDSIVNPDKYMAATCKSDDNFDDCNGEKVQVGEHISPDTKGNFFSNASADQSVNDS